MGAYTNTPLLLDRPILVAAQEYGYSEPNLLLLSVKDEKLRINFPAVYEDIQSCAHNADARSPLDYARDLVASWVVEDWFLQMLVDAGCDASAAGSDRNRNILPGCVISSASDFQVRYQGQELRVELLCDYTGFWRKHGKIDLRTPNTSTCARRRPWSSEPTPYGSGLSYWIWGRRSLALSRWSPISPMAGSLLCGCHAGRRSFSLWKHPDWLNDCTQSFSPPAHRHKKIPLPICLFYGEKWAGDLFCLPAPRLTLLVPSGLARCLASEAAGTASNTPPKTRLS